MFERAYTVTAQNTGQATAVVLENVRLPGEEPGKEIICEAWTSTPNSSDVFLFEGELQISDCQSRIPPGNAGGKVDCLMVIPRGANGHVRVPFELENTLTVFFTFGGTVTLRFKEVRKGEN